MLGWGKTQPGPATGQLAPFLVRPRRWKRNRFSTQGLPGVWGFWGTANIPKAGGSPLVGGGGSHRAQLSALQALGLGQRQRRDQHQGEGAKCCVQEEGVWVGTDRRRSRLQGGK